MTKRQLQNQGLKDAMTAGVVLRNKVRMNAAGMGLHKEYAESSVDKRFLETPKDALNASGFRGVALQNVADEGPYDAARAPGTPKYHPPVLIEKFSKNNEKFKNSESISLASAGEVRLIQKNKKAVLQEIQKFKKKLGRIEDELKKIKKKRIVFNEKEKLLKSKRIKVVSKIKQREIPLEYFEELREPQKETDECLIAEEDFMEQMAVEKLVELSRKVNKY